MPENQFPVNWEPTNDPFTDRAKVFGGWIVKRSAPVVHNMVDTGQGMADGWDWREAICFVPDPNHEWQL